MKFVTPLNDETRKRLRDIYCKDASPARRRRAHAVLLNDKGYGLNALADIFGYGRDTVSSWLTRWEERAFDGLSDEARSGRPPATSAADDKRMVRAVERHPQSLKPAQSSLKKRVCP